MEDFENKTTNQELTPPKDILLAVIITEVLCVAVILLTVVFMKYFWKDGFDEAKDFYSEHFLTETTLSEVIKE